MEIAAIAPETLKPEPKTVAWEIVTGSVPELVRVNICELFEPRGTLPKSTLVVFGASTPAEVEPGLFKLPALVNPTQPERVRMLMNSVKIMADSASEL
jgi:hypothetical protein